MNNVILDSFTKDQLREEPFKFEIGSTVRVHVKIKEGSRERIQVFEGTVIAKKHGGVSETVTVRRVSYGVGVERTFPVNSPTLQMLSLFVAVRFAVQSFTICVTDPVRLLR